MSYNGIEEKLQQESTTYFRQYEDVKRWLEPVHAAVVQGAMIADGGLLTDHGPKHIARVGAVASDLLAQSGQNLSDYEKFLLLVAIQIHDVGNILGRYEHEKKIYDVWKMAIAPNSFDNLDRSLAERIAAVHGGKINGDKNTIQSLNEQYVWNNKPVRPRFLAALLRLSDELAEDTDRAAKIQMSIGSVPKKNEIFHIFAAGLHSIVPEIASSSVRLSFAYQEELFSKTFGKGESEQYLLDEIYERAIKTWLECIYCSRHAREFAISKVYVEIEIFDATFVTTREKIVFSLEDSVYPSSNGKTIFEICGELQNYRGNGELTSEKLKDILRGQSSNSSQVANTKIELREDSPTMLDRIMAFLMPRKGPSR